MSELKSNPAFLTAAGVVALVSIGGVTALGLSAAGIPLLPKADAVVPVEAVSVDQRTLVAAKDSPAVLSIDKLMLGTKTLDATGQVKQGGTPALPYSCPAGAIGTSYSAARTFVHQGERVQVVASAYTAGYGAVAFDAFKTAASGCASGVGTVNTWSDRVGGYPALVTDLKQSSGTTRTMMVRYGDAIIHVQGPAKALHSAAREAVRSLAADETCKNPEQGVSVFQRNPLAGNDFTGLYVDESVSVDEPKQPKIPEDEVFEAVDETESLPALPAVITPAVQPGYPVHPSMPESVKYPVKPQAPQLPELNTTVQVKTEDQTGPGCGWDYVGSPGASFNADEAMAENTETIDLATQKLDDGVQQWTDLTLAYWESADKYARAVKKYLTYSDEVSQVNTAWANIGATWESYRAELAQWQQREEQIATFASDKEEALAKYEQELAQCKIDAAKPKPAPTPTIEATPTTEPVVDPETGEVIEPEPTAAPEVQVVEEVAIPCDDAVKKPQIVDEEPPKPLAKPVEPADPTPKGN